MTTTVQNRSAADWIYLFFWLIIPLVYIRDLQDPSLLSRQFAAGLFLLLLSLIYFKKIFQSGALSWPGIFFGLFFITSIVTSFQAINPVESLGTIARYGLYFAYLMLTVDLLRRGILQRNFLIKGMILLAAVSGIITAFAMLNLMGEGEFFRRIYEVKATFSHKNLLSACLMLCLPFLLIGRLLFKDIWGKLATALFLLLLIEILLLRTRGVWLSLALSSLFGLTLLFSFKKRSSLVLPFKTIAVYMGGAILLAVLLFASGDFRESFTDRANIDKRTVFWDNSWEMMKDHPWGGVGSGNWKIHFPAYGLDALDNSVKQGVTHIQRPHNDYLWVATENGLGGVLFFLAFLACGLLFVIRNLRTSNSAEGTYYQVLLGAGLLSYVIFSFSDFPLERSVLVFLLMNLMALIACDVPPLKMGVAPLVQRLVLLALIFFGLFISWQRMKGERATHAVLEANRQQNAPRLIQAVQEARSDYYNMDNFANPLPYFSGLGYLVQRNSKAAEGEIAEALQIHPHHILSLNLMGNIAKVEGRTAEALQYYERANAISPNFEMALLNRAELHLAGENYTEAFRALAFVSYRSQNPRYLDLLHQTLPPLYQRREEHGKYAELMDYFARNQARTPKALVALYQKFREEN